MTTDNWINLIAPSLIFVMGIGAILLLGYGVRKNKQKWFLYGVAMATITVVLTIDKYPEWGITLGAFSAIAIAIFAGLTLFENRVLRQANEARETQERAERQLRDIIDWAMDIAKCESLSELTVLPVLSFKAAGRALADALI